MPSAAHRPSSKMDTAINMLQHLAALAAHDGEPCSAVLFQAADYLQDMMDCTPDEEALDTASPDLAGIDALLMRLCAAQSAEAQLLQA